MALTVIAGVLTVSSSWSSAALVPHRRRPPSSSSAAVFVVFCHHPPHGGFRSPVGYRVSAFYTYLVPHSRILPTPYARHTLIIRLPAPALLLLALLMQTRQSVAAFALFHR